MDDRADGQRWAPAAVPDLAGHQPYRHLRRAPYVNSADQSGAVPFLDIANRYVLAGAQYNPQVPDRVFLEWPVLLVRLTAQPGVNSLTAICRRSAADRLSSPLRLSSGPGAVIGSRARRGIVSARSGLFLGRPAAVDAVDFTADPLLLRGSYRRFQAGKLCL